VKLRSWAEQLDKLAPGNPVTVVAGWQQKIVIGKNMEVEMGEVTVEVGAPAQTATVEFKDASGNVTTPDETPGWTSSDESVATCSATEDGMTAEVTFVGPGSAIIECMTTETAEDGTPTEIRATGLVNVATGDAVVGEVSFSGGTAGGEVTGGEGGEGEARGGRSRR
jgi:hypothetical protein